MIRRACLAGYALAVDVPECGADAGEIQEMDKYQVFGITNPKEYKMVGLGERRVFLS